ncbi:hypothetical protein DDJ40_08460 [Mycobacteroides abscessus]|nr:hypothetical protein DDJ40_08460 [Mycobacteroides abscessus]
MLGPNALKAATMLDSAIPDDTRGEEITPIVLTQIAITLAQILDVLSEHLSKEYDDSTAPKD